MRKVLLALVLLAIPLGACTGNDDSDATSTTDVLQPGPLQDSLDAGTKVTIGGPVDKSCRGSLAGGFTNTTGKDIRIIGVEPEVSDHATMLGIMTQPVSGGGVGNNPGFPPPEVRRYGDEVRSLIGTTIKAGGEAWFFVGVRLDGEGDGIVKNLAYEYEIDGEFYRAVDDDTFRARERPERGRCPRSPNT